MGRYVNSDLSWSVLPLGTPACYIETRFPLPLIPNPEEAASDRKASATQRFTLESLQRMIAQEYDSRWALEYWIESLLCHRSFVFRHDVKFLFLIESRSTFGESWGFRGDVMEKYEFLKDIGYGNFGVTKLMRNKETKELVAAKYLPRGETVRYSALFRFVWNVIGCIRFYNSLFLF